MKMLKSKLLDLKEKEQKDKIEDLKGDQKDIAWEVKYVHMFFALTLWLKTTEQTMKLEM